MISSTPVPVCYKNPQPGQYISSVAVSAYGGVVVAGTFFHSYGGSADRLSADGSLVVGDNGNVYAFAGPSLG